MKKIIIKTCLLFTVSMLFGSCSKFDQINVDPTAANANQVQVEYFIDNSIIQAQMDPGVSERSFILYWQAAGHQIADVDGETFSWGSYNDGWTDWYYGDISSWLNSANSAIDVANQQIAAGTSKPYTNNLLQVARIWRAYLMSEMSDNFGPIPIQAFQGKNPDFSDVKTVYYFLLDELKDASSKLDVTVVNPSSLNNEDPAYGYNYTKWRKYANSMRLRLSMRLSEVDPAKAKAEFEAAAAGDLITDQSETFQVKEKDGWDPLTGVMSRSWLFQPIAVSMNNILLNLGGIKSQDQLSAGFASSIKPDKYIGESFPAHFSTMTNDPSAGYWLDGLPYAIDPRAYKTFCIPGNVSDPNFPDQNRGYDDVTISSLKDANGKVVKTIDAKNTWNPIADGDPGTKGPAVNQLTDINNFPGNVPRLNMQFRNNTNKRIFFAPWETYFLLAEAALRGWATPVNAQTAYETGIQKSFDYWGVPIGSYLTSQDYNRDGTSVSWNHTVEPGDTHLMNYVDGMTGTPGTVSINYPKNNLYKSGTVRNDQLTKIITQKFIAQNPYLPLEAWSDHRRLGLPFFENVVIENPILTLPALTSATYMTSNVKFFPQRQKYPASLKNSNINGYNQAVGFLGGADEVLTPLWWAQH